MARTPSSILSFIRQNPRANQNPNTHIRNLTVETKERDFTEVAKEVCRITRTKPRWEQTLLSDYPSFDFKDPKFLREYLKHQTNVLLSLRFFFWVSSHGGFSADPFSCNVIFDGLIEAKASNAAKQFLEYTGFSPDPVSLECYIRCLSEGGLVEEALDVFSKLKKVGVCPSILTWNSALLGCLKVGRTDLVWKLYEKLMESDVTLDVETVGNLIQAFCNENKVSKGYELLRQALEKGLAPGNVAFNKLISGFGRENQHARVSELLHAMIAKNLPPDIYTYQEVIHGLCKKRKVLEGSQVFNDLKDRGYAPDRVMYTTMIHGFCKRGWLGDARKLWFEMIQKGYRPNEYTYNIMIHGFSKIGCFEEAMELYKEMHDKGYRDTTVTCNTMIVVLCSNGKMGEAYRFFEEMPQRGIVPDVITYNILIRCFCKEGKILESTNLLNQLLAQGLQPSTASYTPLIDKLCHVGGVREAENLWNDMQSRGLEARVLTRDHIIRGLCNEGFLAEGMKWLLVMLENKLKPEEQTFEKLIECLTQRCMFDDSLFILDLMYRTGYALKEGICNSLVNKLCLGNTNFVETCLGEILERNGCS